MKRKSIFICLMLVGILVWSGCGKEEKKESVSGAQESQEQEIVDYDQLSVNELEVLGYDGDKEAQYRMGLIYEYGLKDQTQDFFQAKEWYERAADQEDERALTALGYLYLNGCGTDVSLDQAAVYFSQAISLGSTEANAGMARTYLAGFGDPAQQAALAFSAASVSEQAEDLDGICLVGYLYEQGIGCTVDYSQAMSRYEKVAETEEPEITEMYAVNQAMTRIGILYMEGKGVEKDETEALDWFEKAADQGYAMAQYYTGIVYENGYGVNIDYGEAMKWYQKAAEQDYAPALNQIGYLYFNGFGVDADYEEAAYYQKMSAMYGYGPAQLNLGFLYENGYGVEQNYQIALAYYQLAADQGMSGATEAVDRVSRRIQEGM